MQAASSYSGKGGVGYVVVCEKLAGWKVVPRLSDMRDKLESIAGKPVDRQAAKRGGKFDHGHYFPIP